LFRRKHYALHKWLHEDTYSCKNRIILHSVDHISIRGDLNTKNDFIDVPNVTELTLYKHSNKSLLSISTILDRIIPLTKLFKLSIHCDMFCISKLMELLYFSPNIHVLAINSISFSKIDAASIQKTQTFRTVFNENKITNLILQKNFRLDAMKLFLNLCPRLEQLTVGIRPHNFTSVKTILSMKNDIHSPHLSFLCFLEANDFSTWRILSHPSSNCSMKLVSQNLYVWY
jgi:hypothetical protein